MDTGTASNSSVSFLSIKIGVVVAMVYPMLYLPFRVNLIAIVLTQFALSILLWRGVWHHLYPATATAGSAKLTIATVIPKPRLLFGIHVVATVLAPYLGWFIESGTL